MAEIWKSVLNWEGHYEVSNRGRVRSLARGMNAGWCGFQTKKGRVIRSWKRQGRIFISLFGDGRRATATVHRLVLEAFVGPRPRGMESRHLDGNVSNNALDNLTWGTKEENENDKFRHGTRNRLMLTEAEVQSIRSSKQFQADLAEQFGITQSMVSRIKSGDRRVP